MSVCVGVCVSLRVCDVYLCVCVCVSSPNEVGGQNAQNTDLISSSGPNLYIAPRDFASSTPETEKCDFLHSAIGRSTKRCYRAALYAVCTWMSPGGDFIHWGRGLDRGVGVGYQRCLLKIFQQCGHFSWSNLRCHVQVKQASRTKQVGEGVDNDHANNNVTDNMTQLASDNGYMAPA